MKRIIGDLGSQIRQPSNPFANLAQRAVRRCQVNAVKHMLPELNRKYPRQPPGAKDLGQDYVLLRYADKSSYTPSIREQAVLQEFAHEAGVDASDGWLAMPRVK